LFGNLLTAGRIVDVLFGNFFTDVFGFGDAGLLVALSLIDSFCMDLGFTLLVFSALVNPAGVLVVTIVLLPGFFTAII
jgi:hypothetical protein